MKSTELREALRNAFAMRRRRRRKRKLLYGGSEFQLHVRDDGIGIAPEVANRGTLAGRWGFPECANGRKKIEETNSQQS